MYLWFIPGGTGFVILHHSCYFYSHIVHSSAVTLTVTSFWVSVTHVDVYANFIRSLSVWVHVTLACTLRRQQDKLHLNIFITFPGHTCVYMFTWLGPSYMYCWNPKYCAQSCVYCHFDGSVPDKFSWLGVTKKFEQVKLSYCSSHWIIIKCSFTSNFSGHAADSVGFLTDPHLSGTLMR